jgi:hypothetical protein
MTLPLVRVVALLALAACGSASVTATETQRDAVRTMNTQLHLTVTDAPAQPGLLFIAGTVTGGPGMVTVSSTRYGSLCTTEITAHADVASGKITLFVHFAERLTICTADIRAITYRAEVGRLAAGTYDVSVVHANADGNTGTVLTQRVTVT